MQSGIAHWNKGRHRSDATKKKMSDAQLGRKHTKETLAKLRTHGMSKTKFYAVYLGLHYRCSNPKSAGYQYYGGRGIKCLWKSFGEFYGDMYASYVESIKINGQRNTTIDRINGNGDYSKENCRWRTYRQQNSNRKDNVFVVYRGEKDTITNLARKYSTKKPIIVAQRLRRGWDIEKSLTTK